MAKKEHKTEVKTLVVVLSLLLLLVVILIVANVLLPYLKDEAKYYSDDNLARECLEKEDSVEMADCLEDKAFSYYDAGDCVDALKVYDDIPTTRFDKYSLADLYNEAYSLSLSCDDESLQDYWSKKYNDLSSQLKGMD